MMKKNTRKLVLLFFSLMLLLSACKAKDGNTTDNAEAKPSPKAEASEVTNQEASPVTVTLYGDFSAGNNSSDKEALLKTEQTELSHLNAQALADALSAWSGLDFTITAEQTANDSITVDWSPSSTLVAGLDDREQKEAFFFFDAESLRWFMLDSLYLTLKENLGVSEVYYTMDGGQTLVLDGLYPLDTFPSDIPFQGSDIYYENADIVDLEEAQSGGIDTTYDTPPAVLVNPARFTGSTPLETDNEYHGGYYYSEMTEDTLTTIINCCAANAMQDGESMESYAKTWANLISPYGIRDFTITATDICSENLNGYPVYLLTWISGENEATCAWNVLFFMTDTHTYMYAFDTVIDHEEEMRDTWYSTFPLLELVRQE